MPSKATSNLAATNQLMISIDVITKGQAWKKQIRGDYTLIYPWAMGDFVHLKDFDQWLKLYGAHTHSNGNNGSPTGPPIAPAIFTTMMAKALLVVTAAVGKIRSGMTEAITSISQLDLFTKRPEL